jgi:hypothetical protein
MPKPFQASVVAFTTSQELVDVLGLLDELHEATVPEEGVFYANAFARELAAMEPAAPTLADDFAAAIAVGIGVHRVAERRPALHTPTDEIAPIVAHVLGWAAMEQAAEAPERHGPWISYATQLGHVLARRGAGALRIALSDIVDWHAGCPEMTHSAYFDQRLVLDIGTAIDGAVVARNYMPLRPAGIEHAHDRLLFETACDDFTERLRGHRVHGTVKLRNVFRLNWKSLR